MSKTTRTKGEAADKILRAAEELFAEQGYSGVSVRDIAQKAGVNKALVFYYFDSKALLLDKVLESYYQAHAAILNQRPEGLSVREGIHSLLDDYLDFMEANYTYVRIVHHELRDSSEHIERIRQGTKMLSERVGELLSFLRDVPDHDRRQFFMSVSGLVTNYFVYVPSFRAITDGDPLDKGNLKKRRAHLHWMMDAMLTGLGVE